MRNVPKARGNLARRVISALVIAPIGLIAIWAGGIVFDILVGIIAVLMAFEWTRLVFGKDNKLAFMVHALFSVIALAVLNIGMTELAFAVMAVGAVVAGVLALSKKTSAIWALAGVIYSTGPLLCISWLRDIPDLGFIIVLAVVLVIVATDIGAYFVGKAIGGPKWIPTISPSKTWAGLGGGMFFGAVIGAALGYATILGSVAFLAVAAALLALISQCGDLLESFVKRRFNAKDSGNLIPGHGGVLDRFDGLMIASVVVALIYVATN